MTTRTETREPFIDALAVIGPTIRSAAENAALRNGLHPPEFKRVLAAYLENLDLRRWHDLLGIPPPNTAEGSAWSPRKGDK